MLVGRDSEPKDIEYVAPTPNNTQLDIEHNKDYEQIARTQR